MSDFKAKFRHTLQVRFPQFLRRQKNRIKYYKTKVYKKCPYCKSILCLPRKKGNHSVRCPRCGQRFHVNI